MKMNMNPNLIQKIVENWDDSRKGAEIQELIEAIVAELKKDYRDYQRKHYRMSSEDVAFWESLIADATDKSFWEKIDYLLNFHFEY